MTIPDKYDVTRLVSERSMLLRDFLRPLGIRCGPQFDRSNDPNENRKKRFYPVIKNTKIGKHKIKLEDISRINVNAPEYFIYLLSRSERGSKGMINQVLG